MLPTLENGDKILLDKNVSELKRGDIIAFRLPQDTSKIFVKRIVGLPNERVDYRQGKVLINGQELNEPYIDSQFNKTRSNFQIVEVPENHYYVIGDNRDNSYDSRNWGGVSKDLITGKYNSTYLKANKK